MPLLTVFNVEALDADIIRVYSGTYLLFLRSDWVSLW